MKRMGGPSLEPTSKGSWSLYASATIWLRADAENVRLVGNRTAAKLHIAMQRDKRLLVLSCVAQCGRGGSRIVLRNPHRVIN
jgi:hypothetical protein